MNKIRKNKKRLLFGAVLMLASVTMLAWADGDPELNTLEKQVMNLTPDPAYVDDAVGIIVVKLALTSLKEGSGGIGACLVDERTGKVIATGRNRQYRPYFRSDLHAEMDLLTRYEDWLRKKGGKNSGANPRDCEGLMLVSSMEPCPMCLTRIINSGIKKMIYLAPDEEGGMVSHIDQLPPFWKSLARNAEYRQAKCSPKIRQVASELFNFGANKRKKLIGSKP